MPPPTWRDLARKAAQVLKRQLAQTEQGLASFLNPGRTPRPIPVPLPQRRAPRFPGDKRYYSQPASLKRSSPRSSGVATLVKTEFGRTLLRPRLSNGTLRLHGYGRNFSTGPIDHANVAREVYQSISQGIRAGVLNTPFYPPPTTGAHKPGQVLFNLRREPAMRTHLDIPLCPAIALPTAGTLSRETLAEVDAVLRDLPQFLTRLRRDLQRLSTAGSFDYTLSTAGSLRITFVDRPADEVEAYLADLGVVSASLSTDVVQHRGAVAWEDVKRPRRRRRKTDDSLDRFIASIDRERRAMV